MTDKCRHSKTWLVAGGYIEWCYECGAMRQMWKSPEGNSVSPLIGEDGKRARWIKPVGTGGPNPYKKLVS